mgnify:CR=1 FL=1
MKQHVDFFRNPAHFGRNQPKNSTKHKEMGHNLAKKCDAPLHDPLGLLAFSSLNLTAFAAGWKIGRLGRINGQLTDTGD